MMPAMSGVELAISVEERFSACRILLFSWQAATADMLEQAEIHGYYFEVLAKPIHRRCHSTELSN